MEMIRLAEEEKPALELTPDIIQAVKSDSAVSHSSVDEAKKTFLEQAKTLKPSVDKDLLDEFIIEVSEECKRIQRLDKLIDTMHEGKAKEHYTEELLKMIDNYYLITEDLKEQVTQYITEEKED